jgi:hypothetical protein
MVALAILADVEPVRPARRKKRNLAINLVKMSVSAQRTVFPGRQDAGLYGRRDARRYIFRLALGISDTRFRLARFFCTDDGMSKLFRNVPCLTHERMSPLLVVVGCSPSPAGGAGRREAGA